MSEAASGEKNGLGGLISPGGLIWAIVVQSVTGANGLGEGGTIGAPAAVLNAVSDALAPFGVGILRLRPAAGYARTVRSKAAERSRRSTSRAT